MTGWERKSQWSHETSFLCFLSLQAPQSADNPSKAYGPDVRSQSLALNGECTGRERGAQSVGPSCACALPCVRCLISLRAWTWEASSLGGNPICPSYLLWLLWAQFSLLFKGLDIVPAACRVVANSNKVMYVCKAQSRSREHYEFWLILVIVDV